MRRLVRGRAFGEAGLVGVEGGEPDVAGVRGGDERDLLMAGWVWAQVLGVVGLGRSPDAKEVEIAVLRHQMVRAAPPGGAASLHPGRPAGAGNAVPAAAAGSWVAFLVTPSTLLRWHCAALWDPREIDGRAGDGVPCQRWVRRVLAERSVRAGRTAGTAAGSWHGAGVCRRLDKGNRP